MEKTNQTQPETLGSKTLQQTLENLSKLKSNEIKYFCEGCKKDFKDEYNIKSIKKHSLCFECNDEKKQKEYYADVSCPKCNKVFKYSEQDKDQAKRWDEVKHNGQCLDCEIKRITIECPVCKKITKDYKNFNCIRDYEKCLDCKNKEETIEKYPARFLNITFEKTQVNEGNKTACEHLKKLDLNTSEKGVLLTGSVGTGKTHLLFCLMTKYRIKITHFVDYITMIYDIKTEMLQEKGKTDFLEFLCNTDILFIDDIGTGKVTEWAVEQVNYIINKRYIHNKLTFITTNLPIDGADSIESNFGARVMSRLVSMNDIFLVQGSDFRIKEGK